METTEKKSQIPPRRPPPPVPPQPQPNQEP